MQFNSTWFKTAFKTDGDTLKGVPIAKFWFSTLEIGHETYTIGFAVPQNPRSGGWNYRLGSQSETGAIFVFSAWRHFVVAFRSLGVTFWDQKHTNMLKWNSKNNNKITKSSKKQMSIFDNFFPSKNRDFFSEFFQFSSVFGQGYITESE